MSKEKVFRDPIYGYISIPDDYCKNFIDTPIFQRLRRIEQTSMRVLFPSDRHDRFVYIIIYIPCSTQSIKTGLKK